MIGAVRDLFLIHGAWQGAWAWGALIPELAARGWRCHAVDLPENGQPGAPRGPASLAAYVQHCLAEMPDRAVVVGHSGGGVTASQLAETAPGRVAALVYVAGIMLPSGTGFAEIVQSLVAEHPQAAGITPHLAWSADGAFSSVPAAAARAIFLQDCPAAVAEAAAARLTRQRETGRALVPTLTSDRFGRIPRIYVEASHDRSVVPLVQRRMQALVAGAQRLTMATGHAPQLAQPAALARLIDGALTSGGHPPPRAFD